MKNQAKLWLCATVLFLFCFNQQAWPQELKSAPDFTLQDLNNDTFTLSSYKYKQPVMLFFWASWCPFCREELQLLSKNYAQLQKEGLALAVINVGESATKVANFSKTHNLPFPLTLDKDTNISRSFGIFGIPTYILIDKKGYIRYIEHYFPKEEYKNLLSE
jgi:cytochrome c biogenesis protein CcmG/thiol:disulfide interchange protein DsbE